MNTVAVHVTVANRLGLHARPAMAIVDAASQFTSDIQIRKEEQTVDAKSIMQLMILAATEGTELELTATGDDADTAISELTALFARKFDED